MSFLCWFINNTIVSIKDSVGKSNVICGISGGVDSSIAATLIHRAIGKQLTSIFVDNGLLRKNEPENVMNFLKKDLGLNVIKINAKKQFLKKLKGITDPGETDVTGKLVVKILARLLPVWSAAAIVCSK